MPVVVIGRVEPQQRNRLIGQGAALPSCAVALIYSGGGFFCAVGEELTAPGFTVEQLTQEIGDFAFTRAGVEQSPACARRKRDEPGSRGFRHV